MIRFRITAVQLCAFLLLVACDREHDEADTGSAPAAGDTAAMGEMADMPGMGGVQGSMMDQMTSHMALMHGATADSMRALLPLHRQRVANMIAQMNREMRDMNMTMDAKWNATVDSLRSDLTNMPGDECS